VASGPKLGTIMFKLASVLAAAAAAAAVRDGEGGGDSFLILQIWKGRKAEGATIIKQGHCSLEDGADTVIDLNGFLHDKGTEMA
jgi:hypothetical protein